MTFMISLRGSQEEKDGVPDDSRVIESFPTSNLELSRALFLKVINSVFYAIEVEKLISEFDSYAIICLVEIVTS